MCVQSQLADAQDFGLGDAAVVAAPAQHAGISSELEALAALHQKGALTDGEFAAAKAKLLG